MIKLLIGGSPCTFWSIAQKNGRETEASGLGWELFKNYVIAKEKFKPDFFLYENNKSAAQPIKDQVAKELGVDLMYINSALVSAQNRQRFYAFNWEVEQPADRGILLRDILETGEDLTSNEKSYTLTASYGGAVAWNTLERSQRNMVAESVDFSNRPDSSCTRITKKVQDTDTKSRTLTASSWKGVESDGMPVIAEPVGVGYRGRMENGKWVKRYESNGEPKANAITTAQTDSMVGEPVRIGDIGSTAQAHRVYSCDGKFNAYNVAEITEKSPTLSTGSMVTSSCATTIFEKSDKPIYEVKDGLITIKDKQYPIKLADGYYIIRKLTPVECERLQTLPDGYTSAVSNSQRYKGLGNGWTADVIIHILNGVLKDIPRDEEIVVLSMYDGIGTGRYCLDKMGFTNVKYFAYEIDKYAKQVATSNYPDIVHLGDAFDLRHPDWTIGY